MRVGTRGLVRRGAQGVSLSITAKGALLTWHCRQRAYIGQVNISFRLRDFFQNVYTESQFDNMRLKIYAGSTLSDENVLFDSEEEKTYTEKSRPRGKEAIIPIQVYGQTWTLQATEIL
jgi:CHASE1-domain containing sensor protein